MNTVIIKSILDNDLYTFTMQQAVMKLYSETVVSYKFKNRGNHKFSQKFLIRFTEEIAKMANLSLTNEEADFLKSMSFLAPWYIEYLKSYRFDPSQLTYYIDDGQLNIDIKGLWYQTILWEVPLMALISELYFSIEDDDWDMSAQDINFNLKTAKLMSASCSYSDFGTRRRRSYQIQDFIVSKMKNQHWFGGTSNVHLAHKYGVSAIGTMAHQWVQAISALESMNHPNRFMLEKWISVYGSNLGIALPDTFGTDSFLRDFNKVIASIFSGVRHDSGNPYLFVDKIIDHYKKLGIKHSQKIIVFSNGLNADEAVKIKKYCDERDMPSAFGIGTAFTNDFNSIKTGLVSTPLNMVIKLYTVNDNYVVKLSDDPGKENGDQEMVDIMKKTHYK